MKKKPWPRAVVSRVRWHLQVLRLHGARLLLLPWRERASRACALVASLGLVVVGVQSVRNAAPATPEQPVEAAIPLIWQIGLLVLSALLSYALAPKPKAPEKLKSQIPETEDGKGIVTVLGEVWIDDSIVLGWKDLEPEPIKAKSGKK